jgi:hypothetical protein
MRNVNEMTTDELLMSIGRPGVADEIERRRKSREQLNQRIADRELLAARSRVAGR